MTKNTARWVGKLPACGEAVVLLHNNNDNDKNDNNNYDLEI